MATDVLTAGRDDRPKGTAQTYMESSFSQESLPLSLFTTEEEAQSFRMGQMTVLVAVSPESSLWLPSVTADPSQHRPEDWRTGICVHVFMFGLLGPIKEGENFRAENHLEPREQPDRPAPAQTDPGFQRRPASPPPRTAAR